MRPGVSLGVLWYPRVSWGNQTDPVKYGVPLDLGRPYEISFK